MDIEKSSKPIVVGVDGSVFSHAALRWALEEGARRECPVQAVTVAHAAPVVAAGRPTTVGLGVALPGTPDEKYLRRLETTVREVLGDRDDPRLTAELVEGSAPEVLCSASGGAQLIVLGSHGHGQVFEAVLGSVSQYCVRHAHCPVVVIPAQLVEPAISTDTAVSPTEPQPLSYGLGPLL
jgi:nucleotide-binding universal stress UspA family protein